MKSTIYTAPSGFVYDYLNPKMGPDGEELHLYANKLSISRFDTIDNYQLILDPKEKVE